MRSYRLQMELKMSTTTNSLWNALSPLIAAAIGGFAALGGQLIATKSSDRSIEQIAVQSCIQRIDTQEAKLREVGERLFGTLGSLIGASVENDQQSFNSAGKEIIRAAFEVNAYAPPELALAALTIAQLTRQGMTASTPEQQETAIRAAFAGYRLWPQQYREQMVEFDKLRHSCESSRLANSD